MRRAFFGLASFEALAMFRNGLFYSYLSIYLRSELGLSVTETTLFATFPMLANVGCQTFVWGKVSDRFQKRRSLIIGGELLAGLGTVLIWVAHQFQSTPTAKGYAIILGLTCVEAFWSMSNVGRSAMLSDIYEETERAGVLGRLASFRGVGRLIGVAIGGVMYDLFGTRPAGWGFQTGTLFFIASGIMLVSIIPMLFVPEGGTGEEVSDADRLLEFKQAETMRLFLVFLLGLTLIHWGRNSIAVIRSPYLDLEQGFGVSAFALSWILNTEAGASILMGFGVGWFCRRHGSGKVLLVGAVLSIVSLMIYVIADHLWMIYASNLLRGLANALIMASSYAFASVLIPSAKRGRHFSWFNATLYLSWGIAGTAIAGPIVDQLTLRGWAETHAYKAAFAAAAIITGMGLAVMCYVVFAMYPRYKAGKTPV